MAAVDMNHVEFYNPKPAPKPPQTQPAMSALNMHRRPLQPIVSQTAASVQKVRGNDSSDDSLLSLDELFRPSRNRDIPKVPPQNGELPHASKNQLFDDGRLPTDFTTRNSVYAPGKTQEEPLVIEDDGDDESDDEAETGIASGDLHASLEDASVCGLTTEDTASTASSLFGPSTPRDSEPDADYFYNEEPRPSFAEQNSTSPVHVQRPSLDYSEPAWTKNED